MLPSDLPYSSSLSAHAPLLTYHAYLNLWQAYSLAAAATRPAQRAEQRASDVRSERP